MICVMTNLQAMALEHAGVVEVACNLLEWQTTGPEQVQQAVVAAAAAKGMVAQDGYVIGKPPAEMMRLAAEAWDLP
jgi:stage V sporulation protein SpoVS